MEILTLYFMIQCYFFFDYTYVKILGIPFVKKRQKENLIFRIECSVYICLI